MSMYVILKIVRSCGHAENVSFDTSGMFEEAYHHQLTLPCVSCIRGISVTPPKEEPKIEPVVELPESMSETVAAILEKEMKHLTSNGDLEEDLEQEEDEEIEEDIPEEADNVEISEDMIDSDDNPDPTLLEVFDSLSEEEQRDELIKLYIEQTSLVGIARVFNTTPYTVKCYLRKYNITFETIEKRLEEIYDPEKIPYGPKEFWRVRGNYRRQLLIKMKAKYKTYNKVAKVLGLHINSLMHYYNQNNITNNEIRKYMIQQALKAQETKQHDRDNLQGK